MGTLGPKEKSTVYVVDDDASIRKALERLLRSEGYQALTFESAESFLQSIIHDREGCLILDIRLPGMDAFELQELLASRGAKYSVIFITAHDNQEWREKGRKAGAVAYLKKPFSEKALFDAIRLGECGSHY